MQLEDKFKSELSTIEKVEAPRHLSSLLIARGTAELLEQRKIEQETHDYWLNRGNGFAFERRYVDAKHAFLRGLEMEPTDAIIMKDLGEMYYKKFLESEIGRMEQTLEPETSASSRASERDFDSAEQAVWWWLRAREFGYPVDEFRIEDLRNFIALRSTPPNYTNANTTAGGPPIP